MLRFLPVLLLILMTACAEGHPPDTGAPASDLDPTLDSDGDGIPDVVELEEGTDPHDPSSASAWHPEVQERPRLLLGPERLGQLTAALAMETEPYATLRGRIEGACAAEPHEQDDSLLSATVNGNIAMACALLYAGGNQEAGRKAAEVLEKFPVEGSMSISLVYKIDLYGSQGLTQGVRAWDLLLGVGYPEGGDPDLAEERLHMLADYLWEIYVETAPEIMAFAANNHATKLAAAFGLMGMGANMDPRAAARANYGVAEVARLHDILLAADGTYAEGPSYLVYAMETVLPWLAALDRWLGEDEMLVKTLCDHDLTEGCEEELVSMGSLLRDPRVCDSFERFTEMLMPSGHAPNYDDSNLAMAHLGFTASLCESATQAWGWGWQAAPWVSSGSVHLTGDTTLWWQEPTAEEPPPEGLIQRHDGGYTVMRGGWSRDSSYALFLAESGVAREGGGGHEHPDALSFLWSSKGEYLLLDAGYGSWETSQDVRKAKAHNVILVDGANTVTEDAWFVEGVQEGPFQVAVAEVELHGVRWRRALIQILDEDGDDMLVAWDVTEPVDGGAHELALQLQGPTDHLTWDGELARWAVGDLELQAAVLADADVEVSTRSEVHASAYATISSHGALEALHHGAATVVWLTVAAVGDGSAPLVAVEGDGVTWSHGSASLAGLVIHRGYALLVSEAGVSITAPGEGAP